MIKRTKLCFKGDKSSVISSSNSNHKNAQESAEESPTVPLKSCLYFIYALDWIHLTEENDLIGPLWLTFERDAQSYCLSFNELGSVNVVQRTEDDTQPSASNQILVGHFVGDKSHFSMKTSHGRYVSYDKYGFIETKKEAIGPHELWSPIIVHESDEVNGPAYLIFKRKTNNTDDTEYFLQYDFTLKCLRADIDSLEDATKFYIFIQSARKQSLNGNAESDNFKDKFFTDLSNYEDDQMKRYLSCYNGNISSLKRKIQKSNINLKAAEQSGNLHSTLLDRREKLKSDKYCK